MMISLHLLIPLLAAAAVAGLACITVACLRRPRLHRQLPSDANWTPFNELSMAFILTNAGLFFAVHCLRGAIILAVAIALPLLAAIGSHLRYRQLLAQQSPDDGDAPSASRRPILLNHLLLCLGILCLFAAELIAILLVLSR